MPLIGFIPASQYSPRLHLVHTTVRFFITFFSISSWAKSEPPGLGRLLNSQSECERHHPAFLNTTWCFHLLIFTVPLPRQDNRSLRDNDPMHCRGIPDILVCFVKQHRRLWELNLPWRNTWVALMSWVVAVLRSLAWGPSYQSIGDLKASGAG